MHLSDIEKYQMDKFEIIDELLKIQKFNEMSKVDFVELYKKVMFTNKILLKYGSKDQINRFIYDILNRKNVSILLYSIEDILLFFIHWYLTEFEFDSNLIIEQIHNIINDINTKNSELLSLISTRLIIIKNNSSHHNIFDFLEHLNNYANFFHTNEIRILCNILVNIYNNDVLFDFQDMVLLFDKKCNNSFKNIISKIESKTFTIDLFYDQIFTKNDVVEMFTKSIIKTNLLQVNLSERSISQESLNKINNSLHNLSKYILSKNDISLYKLFIAHYKILHETIL